MGVSLIALWLPIIVAAVIVFIAGFILNTVLPHHRTDFARLPDEDKVREATQGLAQGQYIYPYASTPAEMKDPALIEKAKAGPVGMLVVWPNGAGPTPKQLITHFVYVLVISLFAGYIGSASLEAGTEYLKIFQVVGASAFLAYAGAVPLFSIWYHMTWSFTVKELIDGLVYALLTAGVFGWLWP
ncbi:MAG: hypothetical protein IH820_13200 [Bacteroidetes bacterium]|nr:hypothetical protein [Bacteroidota bacterium]